jgi:hypothetical protein
MAGSRVREAEEGARWVAQLHSDLTAIRSWIQSRGVDLSVWTLQILPVLTLVSSGGPCFHPHQKKHGCEHACPDPYPGEGTSFGDVFLALPLAAH